MSAGVPEKITVYTSVSEISFGGCRRRAVGRVHIASTCFASLEIILGVCSGTIAGTLTVLFESLAGVQREQHICCNIPQPSLHAGRGDGIYVATAVDTHPSSLLRLVQAQVFGFHVGRLGSGTLPGSNIRIPSRQRDIRDCSIARSAWHVPASLPPNLYCPHPLSRPWALRIFPEGTPAYRFL